MKKLNKLNSYLKKINTLTHRYQYSHLDKCDRYKIEVAHTILNQYNNHVNT